MIVKNIKTGKYEIIENNYSYYFDIIFSKYNINISSPSGKIHNLIKDKIAHVYK
jgi:hypothetical protein